MYVRSLLEEGPPCKLCVDLMANYLDICVVSETWYRTNILLYLMFDAFGATDLAPML